MGDRKRRVVDEFIGSAIEVKDKEVLNWLNRTSKKEEIFHSDDFL